MASKKGPAKNGTQLIHVTQYCIIYYQTNMSLHSLAQSSITGLVGRPKQKFK